MFLKLDEDIELPRLIEGKVENMFMRLSTNSEGEGTFYWNKFGINLQDGFAIPVQILSQRMIVCFTSTITNTLWVSKLLSLILGLKPQIIRLPFRWKHDLDEEDVVSYKRDPIVGASFILVDDGLPKASVNIYTNGLTSFSVTNNDKVVNRIMSLTLKLSENIVLNNKGAIC